MPRFTFKEGACAECGSNYNGFICDERPDLSRCPKCRGNRAVENARTLYYREFIPYWDGGLGAFVSSRRDRQDKMAQLGVVEISDVAPNDSYLMDDMSSYARARKRDLGDRETKVDDEFLGVYREVEQKSGRSV